MTDERLLRLPDAGEMVGKSGRTIRRRIDTGQIKAVRFEGKLRVPLSEMNRIINEAKERAGCFS